MNEGKVMKLFRPVLIVFAILFLFFGSLRESALTVGIGFLFMNVFVLTFFDGSRSLARLLIGVYFVFSGARMLQTSVLFLSSNFADIRVWATMFVFLFGLFFAMLGFLLTFFACLAINQLEKKLNNRDSDLSASFIGRSMDNA